MAPVRTIPGGSCSGVSWSGLLLFSIVAHAEPVKQADVPEHAALTMAWFLVLLKSVSAYSGLGYWVTCGVWAGLQCKLSTSPRDICWVPLQTPTRTHLFSLLQWHHRSLQICPLIGCIDESTSATPCLSEWARPRWTVFAAVIQSARAPLTPYWLAASPRPDVWNGLVSIAIPWCRT